MIIGKTNLHQHYSQWRALASFTTLFQPSLSSTLPLQPLTHITTLSNHLVHGCPLPLFGNNLTFKILLSICSSNIFSTCPSHLILCAFTNFTMSGIGRNTGRWYKMLTTVTPWMESFMKSWQFLNSSKELLMIAWKFWQWLIHYTDTMLDTGHCINYIWYTQGSASVIKWKQHDKPHSVGPISLNYSETDFN